MNKHNLDINLAITLERDGKAIKGSPAYLAHCADCGDAFSDGTEPRHIVGKKIIKNHKIKLVCKK